jgi:hypothetical protein
VLPFAAALVVAVGLIVLIALQFGPGLGTGHTSAPPAPADSSPAPPPSVPSASSTEEKKPSPMGTPVTAPVEPAPNPAQTAAAQTSGQKLEAPTEKQAETGDSPPPSEERPQLKARPANGPQDVLVTSEPPGATAVLDNNPAASCNTPCMLSVIPGRHTVILNHEGYQRERREVRITDSPTEIPMITLRAVAGMLMLTSIPDGAAIFVDGKQISQTTPAQVTLAPGTHNVRVEKNGAQKSQSIEIQNGETIYRKLPLQ